MVGVGDNYDYTELEGYDLIQLEGGVVRATLAEKTAIDPAFHAVANTTSKFDINGSHLQLNGTLTGSGTINKAAGDGQLHFNGDASGFSGTIQSSSNYISILNPKAAANQATYDIATNCGMVFTPSQSSDVFSLGMLTGGGTVRPGTHAATKITAIRVGETNMGGTFSGVLQDYPDNNLVMAVEKAGTGTWILTGANTYTGATTVSGGVLQIGNATQAGSLSVTTAITVTGGAALQVNNSNGEWSNSLKLNNGTLTNGMSNNGLVWKGGITLEGDNTISASSSNIQLNGTVNQASGTTTFSISEGTSYKIYVENAVTGKGTFRLDKTDKISQQLHFLGDLSGFTGRIEIASGTGF
ncbi:MAG: autotransporter-associated beta strand repeat-containing protein, partial [Planctomycetia bacterium]|nr:autotransporter-associated beta strand repeat-containing protein [Planctomycetia bacterium]